MGGGDSHVVKNWRLFVAGLSGFGRVPEQKTLSWFPPEQKKESERMGWTP
jgi:hypothetical protein